MDWLSYLLEMRREFYWNYNSGFYAMLLWIETKAPAYKTPQVPRHFRRNVIRRNVVKRKV